MMVPSNKRLGGGNVIANDHHKVVDTTVDSLSKLDVHHTTSTEKDVGSCKDFAFIKCGVSSSFGKQEEEELLRSSALTNATEDTTREFTVVSATSSSSEDDDENPAATSKVNTNKTAPSSTTASPSSSFASSLDSFQEVEAVEGHQKPQQDKDVPSSRAAVEDENASLLAAASLEEQENTESTSNGTAVRFGTIEIREYPFDIGNAIPSSGVPIGISWEYCTVLSDVSVIEYETLKQPPPPTAPPSSSSKDSSSQDSKSSSSSILTRPSLSATTMTSRKGTEMIIPSAMRKSLLLGQGITMREINTIIAQCDKIRSERTFTATRHARWDKVDFLLERISRRCTRGGGGGGSPRGVGGRSSGGR